MTHRLKAFVAHSFDKSDASIVQRFLDHLDAFKSAHFEWEHATKWEELRISDKVKRKLNDKNVFIGIFTKKFPLCTKDSFIECLFSKRKKHARYISSGWIFQESGYSIAKEHRLILLFEEGIEDTGGLQSDREYIPFNRNDPSEALTKLTTAINQLLKADSSLPVDQENTTSPPEKGHEEKKEETLNSPNSSATSDTDNQEGKGSDSGKIFSLIDDGKDKEAEGEMENLIKSYGEEKKAHFKAFFEYYRARASRH